MFKNYQNLICNVLRWLDKTGPCHLLFHIPIVLILCENSHEWENIKVDTILKVIVHLFIYKQKLVFRCNFNHLGTRQSKECKTIIYYTERREIGKD